MDPTLITTALLVGAFAILGSAKLAAAPAMRARAEHVGFTTSSYRGIGALELMAVVGLLIGIWVPAVGVLAALGLVALLAGAVVVHVRNGDTLGQIAPALLLLLVTVGYLVLTVGGLS